MNIVICDKRGIPINKGQFVLRLNAFPEKANPIKEGLFKSYDEPKWVWHLCESCQDSWLDSLGIEREKE